MAMIDLDNETVEIIRRLESRAAAQAVSLAEYLARLAEYDENPVFDDSLEAFERNLKALSDGLEGLPSLPPDFSREDIYADHD